jgi:chromate transporter
VDGSPVKAAGGQLVAIAAQFAVLSLIAFGGANAVIPEMHRQSVELHHWMSDGQFANLFAIAQAAPGPNVLISTLIGWKVAGVVGGVVATLAMCAPSCVLTYFAAKVWDRHREAPWRTALASGLTPVTVGLVLASAWLLARGADLDWRLAGATIAVAVATLAAKINPLWCLAAAAALGWAGVFGA